MCPRSLFFCFSNFQSSFPTSRKCTKTVPFRALCADLSLAWPTPAHANIWEWEEVVTDFEKANNDSPAAGSFQSPDSTFCSRVGVGIIFDKKFLQYKIVTRDPESIQFKKEKTWFSAACKCEHFVVMSALLLVLCCICKFKELIQHTATNFILKLMPCNNIALENNAIWLGKKPIILEIFNARLLASMRTVFSIYFPKPWVSESVCVWRNLLLESGVRVYVTVYPYALLLLLQFFLQIFILTSKNLIRRSICA